MRTERLLWATAVSGMRIANAFSFVLLIAFIGTALGAIEGHPLLSAWLVLPLLAILVFENFWITGQIQSVGFTRLGAAVSLLVAAGLTIRLVGGNGFAMAVTILMAFLAIIALAALGRPVPVESVHPDRRDLR